MNSTEIGMRILIDEYGNIHSIREELARGGQGIVYRTTDGDLAVKQPLDTSGMPDQSIDLRQRFHNIRLLPLPDRIQISLPLAILRDEPGYVMRLLNGMKPFESLEMNGTVQQEIREGLFKGCLSCPAWLQKIPDEKVRLRLFHYARTGSTRRRLIALAKCASILARLHSVGLVYGDISGKNVFIGDGETPEVWLIDADNLRLEMNEGGSTVYTPHYGAPEIVQGRDWIRPRTDCWAFAVLAFQSLTLCHPFIGRTVLEPDSNQGGWDTDPKVPGDTPADIDEQAYAGYLPYIDDGNDDSNAAIPGSGLPRELIMTPEIMKLFQETFGIGRTEFHRRPSMAFWALELMKAFDRSLTCPECAMSYFVTAHAKCPYCNASRPPFARIISPKGELCVSHKTMEIALPHRLFNPFSLQHSDDTEYEIRLDWSDRSMRPIRGTKPLPKDLSIEFAGDAT